MVPDQISRNKATFAFSSTITTVFDCPTHTTMSATRQQITVAQKVALRRHKRENPQLQRRHLTTWFIDKFHQPIHASSVGDILSDRYKNLDDIPDESPRLQYKKYRISQYPEVETALYSWMEEQARPLKAKELRDQARIIWQSLPQHADVPEPSFGDSWIRNFKIRHDLEVSSRFLEVESGEGKVESTADGEQTIMEGVEDYSPLPPRQLDHAATPLAGIEAEAAGCRDMPPIKHAEALQMLASLQVYEEQAKHPDVERIRQFRVFEGIVRERLLESLRQ